MNIDERSIGNERNEAKVFTLDMMDRRTLIQPMLCKHVHHHCLLTFPRYYQI